MKTALAALVLLAAMSTAAPDEVGKIMRPADKSALASDEADIVATAPGGSLEIDGSRIAAEQPFPNVLHAKLKLAPGVHSLALVWADGRREVRFYTGPKPPEGFAAFHQHPPLKDVPCTQCHELTRRGRFHFKGGCFDCHQQQVFAKVHTHTSDVLAQCGLCHNAHGSTVKAHLLYAKETACKQCHN